MALSLLRKLCHSNQLNEKPANFPDLTLVSRVSCMLWFITPATCLWDQRISAGTARNTLEGKRELPHHSRIPPLEQHSSNDLSEVGVKHPKLMPQFGTFLMVTQLWSSLQDMLRSLFQPHCTSLLSLQSCFLPSLLTDIIPESIPHKLSG